MDLEPKILNFVLRYFIIFNNDEMIEISNVDYCIFSESLTGRHEDSILNCNFNNLYRIEENANQKFVIHNLSSIKNKIYKEKLIRFVQRLNNDACLSLKNEIYNNIEKNTDIGHKRLKQKVIFYLKILDLKIDQITYWKLHSNDGRGGMNIFLSEIEMAQIFNSHIFSYINNHQKLCCEFISIMLREEFNLITFEKAIKDLILENLKHCSRKKITEKIEYEKNVIIDIKKEQKSILETSTCFHMIDQIFNNFFCIFFDFCSINVFDNKNQQLILKYYAKKNTQSKISLNTSQFSKLLSFFPLKHAIIEINWLNYHECQNIIELILVKNIDILSIDLGNYMLTAERTFIIHKKDSLKVLDEFLNSLPSNDRIFFGFDNTFSHSYNENHGIIPNDYHAIKYVESLSDSWLQYILRIYSSDDFSQFSDLFQRIIFSFIKQKFYFEENISIANIKLLQFQYNSNNECLFTNVLTQLNQEKEKKLKIIALPPTEHIGIYNFDIIDYLFDTIYITGYFKTMNIFTKQHIDIYLNQNYMILKFYLQNNPKLKSLKKIHEFIPAASEQNEYIEKLIICDTSFNLLLNNFLYIVSNDRKSYFYHHQQVGVNVIRVQNSQITFMGKISHDECTFNFDSCILKSVDGYIRNDIKLFQKHKSLLNFHIKECEFQDNPRFENSFMSLNLTGCKSSVQIISEQAYEISVKEHDGEILIDDCIHIYLKDSNSFFKFLNRSHMFDTPVTGFTFFAVQFQGDTLFKIDVYPFKLENCRFSENANLLIETKNEQSPFNFFERQNIDGNFHKFSISMEISNSKINEISIIPDSQD